MVDESYRNVYKLHKANNEQSVYKYYAYSTMLETIM